MFGPFQTAVGKMFADIEDRKMRRELEEIVALIEARAQSRPTAMEFEMAYQARVAMDRIRFAIKHTEQFAPHIDQMREAGLQLLEALDRLETSIADSRPPGRPVNIDLCGPGGVPPRLGRPRAAVRPQRILTLNANGWSVRRIDAETGISAMTAQRILKA